MAITLVSRLSAQLTYFSNPGRAVSNAQTHAAGNLLVVSVSHVWVPGVTPVIGSITNTAGDTWVPSASTPYLGAGTHAHECWYVLSTNGAVNDVITLFNSIPTGSWTDGSFAVFEFSTGASGPAFTYQSPDAVGKNETDLNDSIVSSLLVIKQPSVIIANYRNSNNNTPTNPSGTQNHQIDDLNQSTHWDSYKITNAGGAVTATITGAAGAQWSILASVFNGGLATTPPGVGCSGIT